MQRLQQLDEAIPHDGFVEDKDLLFYYDKLFPFRELSLWLTYGNQSHLPESETNDPLFFAKREICLTCRRPAAAARAGRGSSNSTGDRGSSTDEFFVRWQSFRTVEALKERLKDMSDLVTFKFDIGAVYSLPVSEKDCFPTGFKAGQKELVFDIDMNDYDDIRTCCKDKQVCKKCWRFLELAMVLLDTALREDFGFANLLWVFSGRRGVHCWVCDSAARLLPSEARAHLCEYLNLCTGTSQQTKKVSLRPRLLGGGGGRGGGAYASQHYFVDRAFCVAYKHFPRLLKEQDFFNDLPASPSAAGAAEAGGGGGGSAAAFDLLLSEAKEGISYNYEKLLGYLPDPEENSGSSWNAHASSRAAHSNSSSSSSFPLPASSSSFSSSSSINGSSKDAAPGVLLQVRAFIKRKQQQRQQQQRRQQQRQQQQQHGNDSRGAPSAAAGAAAQPLVPSYSSEELFAALCLAAGCPLPEQFDGSPAALKSVPYFIKEIVLAYAYPRLDINVSKDIAHLLKAPFCVHPGTGRICVPLEPPRTTDVPELLTFDPNRVPTLKLLRQQFDDPSRAHLPPEERTSLSSYVRFFRQEFLQTLLHAVAQENKYVRQLLNAADAFVKPEMCF